MKNNATKRETVIDLVASHERAAMSDVSADTAVSVMNVDSGPRRLDHRGYNRPPQ
jgi:hypothetical protein